MEKPEDRQRLDRWIEESQHFIGYSIPRVLDERDHLRRALEAAQQECAGLRQEIDDLTRHVRDLEGETHHLRNERAAIAAALGNILESWDHVQRCLSEVYTRVHATEPSGLAAVSA